MMRMYDESIKVTAYNSDVEAWRLARIHRVIGYVQARMDVAGDSNIFEKVQALHDHKGELMVNWRVSPTPFEKKFFEEAWCSQIGDGADNVTHETA